MSQDPVTQGADGPEMSLAEWMALPEDEEGEFIDGKLVEEEMPDAIHEILVAWFVRILGAWAAPRGGVVLGSEAKFAVRPRRGRKPDLSLYLPGSRMPPRRGLIGNPPDVMLEVLSPGPRDGRRDRVEKPEDYAAFGVRYYWLLDPQLRTLEVMELGGDRRYVRALGVSEGIVSPVPGCEGLSLDLGELWREIDRLGPEEPPEA